MNRYPRKGWAVTVDSLCGTYVDLTADDRGKTDVLLFATQAEAEADLADTLDMMRDAVDDGDMTDCDDDESGIAFVGIDRRGNVFELDPLTGDCIRPLRRGDH